MGCIPSLQCQIQTFPLFRAEPFATTGLADLIDVQNFCKLCPFSTRKVHEAHGESDMERIDGEVVNHLWNMHKTEVSRKVQEQKAIEIASKPGQLRLL